MKLIIFLLIICNFSAVAQARIVSEKFSDELFRIIENNAGSHWEQNGDVFSFSDSVLLNCQVDSGKLYCSFEMEKAPSAALSLSSNFIGEVRSFIRMSPDRKRGSGRMLFSCYANYKANTRHCNIESAPNKDVLLYRTNKTPAELYPQDNYIPYEIYVSNGFRPVLDKDGILRSTDGRILSANAKEALTACPRGTHLPTAQEFINYAVSQGAAGTSLAENDVPGRYVDKVDGRDRNGKELHVRYSAFGYARPGGDLGQYYFWSKTESFDALDSPTDFNSDPSLWKILIFRGRDGGIVPIRGNFDSDTAVRCFRNKK